MNPLRRKEPSANPAPLLDRLISGQIAGCSCGTKPPDVQYHADACHYRLHYESREALLRLSRALQGIAAGTNEADRVQVMEQAMAVVREIGYQGTLFSSVPGCQKVLPPNPGTLA